MCDDLDYGADESFDDFAMEDVSDDSFDADDLYDDIDDDFTIEDVSDDSFDADDLYDDIDDDFAMEDVSDDSFDTDDLFDDVDDDLSTEDISGDSFEADDLFDEMEASINAEISDDAIEDSFNEVGLIENEELEFDDLDINDMFDEINDDTATGDVGEDSFEADDLFDEFENPILTENESGIEADELGNDTNELNTEGLEQTLLENEINNELPTNEDYIDGSDLDENIDDLSNITDEQIAQLIEWENARDDGYYDLIDEIYSDDSLTADQKEFMAQELLNELENSNNEGLNFNPEEYELTDEDLDSVYEGLEDYDFHGVDCFEDTERLDSSLENFTDSNWENLSLEEQKESMENLAQYIMDVTGLENPPKIEFYNNPSDGDYGGYNNRSNVLSINEYMLYQNDEAADTVAHELWHAYQYQRAMNPQTKEDLLYAENFRDYIRPDDDFEAYQSQILESEARAFAQQIKDRLHSY